MREHAVFVQGCSLPEYIIPDSPVTNFKVFPLSFREFLEKSLAGSAVLSTPHLQKVGTH
jgi:hypothetical protein